jgi:anti-sigma factor RsiW
MSCSPFDLKDYFLQELGAPDRREVEKHLGACAECREELEGLRLTEAALRSVADEEIPRGIAFVSDKVFEPSPLRRWWQAFWASSARLGFVSAAILSIALMVSALTRPAPAPVVQAPTAQIDTARLETELSRRMQEAIVKAVAESEARQAKKSAELVRALEKRDEFERRGLILAMNQNIEVVHKQMNRMAKAYNDLAANQEITQ